MPDRLALYPQEVCGAAIERAILDLEATAWDRTPGETFPSVPETHADSFVLLEGRGLSATWASGGRACSTAGRVTRSAA